MPDLLSLIKQLEEELRVRIKYLPEATSSNDIASSSEHQNGEVIWVERQTQGRGQRGNTWNSATGENLTFSIVLTPENLPAEYQFYISKVISITMIEALAAFDLPASIKWPNDIYTADRKVAGVLIENDMLSNLIVKSIAGIGLNVNQREFDPTLPDPTSMAIESNQTYERVGLLKKILERLFCWLEALRNQEYNRIDDCYSQYLYRREGVFSFQTPGGERFSAEIDQVMPSGELVLRLETGERKGFYFKEVEFIIKKGE